VITGSDFSFVGVYALASVNTKIIVLCDTIPCFQVERYQIFQGKKKKPIRKTKLTKQNKTSLKHNSFWQCSVSLLFHIFSFLNRAAVNLSVLLLPYKLSEFDGKYISPDSQ
jgi:hypothetical protein